MTTELKDKPEIVENIDLEEQLENHSWFKTLSKAEKRFHILFYALAGLTGLLVVQLIWQVAIVTAK